MSPADGRTPGRGPAMRREPPGPNERKKDERGRAGRGGESEKRRKRERKTDNDGIQEGRKKGARVEKSRKREFEGPEGSPRPAREAKFGRREKKRSQRKKGGLGGREPPRGKIGENPADGQKQTE